MKIELELGTNDLGHDLLEQLMIVKLKDTYESIGPMSGVYHNKQDKKYDKRLKKSIVRVLDYYGVKM